METIYWVLVAIPTDEENVRQLTRFYFATQTAQEYFAELMGRDGIEVKEQGQERLLSPANTRDLVRERIGKAPQF